MPNIISLQAFNDTYENDGVDIGEALGGSGVSTGTATTSKKVEVRIEDGVSGNNKKEVLSS